MKRMILTKLTLSGVGKKDAVLTFERGLNVITGDSDTGKTFAFQCINYILGGENPPRILLKPKIIMQLPWSSLSMMNYTELKERLAQVKFALCTMANA